MSQVRHQRPKRKATLMETFFSLFNKDVFHRKLIAGNRDQRSMQQILSPQDKLCAFIIGATLVSRV